MYPFKKRLLNGIFLGKWRWGEMRGTEVQFILKCSENLRKWWVQLSTPVTLFRQVLIVVTLSITTWFCVLFLTVFSFHIFFLIIWKIRLYIFYHSTNYLDYCRHILQATYDKMLKEVPTYKLITPSIVSERMKVRGSLARKALRDLSDQGKPFSLCL